MRGLVFALMLLAFEARAVNSVTQYPTNVGGAKLQTSAPAGGSATCGDTTGVGTICNYPATAYATAVKISGVVNFSVRANTTGPMATMGYIQLSFAKLSGGITTVLCTSASISPANTPGVFNTYTGSCTAPATVFGVGDQVVMQFAPVSGDAASSTSTVDGAAENMAWNEYCSTDGTAVACGGICNGAVCGTGSTGAGITCTTDCTSCSGTSIAGPGGLACVDQNNNANAACSWSALAGASTYTLNRGATQVFTGGGLSYTDNPGPGAVTYNLKANGACTPPGGGTTLASKDTNFSTTSLTVLLRTGVIINCQ